MASEIPTVQLERNLTAGEYQLPPFSVPATLAGALATIVDHYAAASASHGDLRVTAAIIMNNSADVVTAIDEHGRQFPVQRQQTATWDFAALREGGTAFLAVRPTAGTNAGDIVAVVYVAPASRVEP